MQGNRRERQQPHSPNSLSVASCPASLEEWLARLKSEQHPTRGLVRLLRYDHMLIERMDVAKVTIYKDVPHAKPIPHLPCT